MNSSQEFLWEYNCAMNSRDTLKKEITLQSIALSLDNITKTLGNFATKKELNQAFAEFSKNFVTKSDFSRFVEKTEASFARLEDLIDGLAITTKTEISKTEQVLSARIDELEQKVDRNHTYAVNQLDNILTHYARREEYNYHGERLKKLERKVFA